MGNDGVRGFVHCKQCVLRQQVQRLEVGVTDEGLLVSCKKHGIVVHFTPELLAETIASPPPCDLCARGEPHAH